MVECAKQMFEKYLISSINILSCCKATILNIWKSEEISVDLVGNLQFKLRTAGCCAAMTLISGLLGTDSKEALRK